MKAHKKRVLCVSALETAYFAEDERLKQKFGAAIAICSSIGDNAQASAPAARCKPACQMSELTLHLELLLHKHGMGSAYFILTRPLVLLTGSLP